MLMDILFGEKKNSVHLKFLFKIFVKIFFFIFIFHRIIITLENEWWIIIKKKNCSLLDTIGCHHYQPEIPVKYQQLIELNWIQWNIIIIIITRNQNFFSYLYLNRFSARSIDSHITEREVFQQKQAQVCVCALLLFGFDRFICSISENKNVQRKKSGNIILDINWIDGSIFSLAQFIAYCVCMCVCVFQINSAQIKLPWMAIK